MNDNVTFIVYNTNYSVKHTIILMTTIETLKLDTEVISIEQFMSLTEKEKGNISSVKIIPPHLVAFDLEGDFGKIKVKYKVPTYKGL